MRLGKTNVEGNEDKKVTEEEKKKMYNEKSGKNVRI
jgi:hypothetical protein